MRRVLTLGIGLALSGSLLVSCGSSRNMAAGKKTNEVKKETSKDSKVKTKRIQEKYEKMTGLEIGSKSLPLYSFIDKWYGVPYCYGGGSHKCTDCSGFACNLYKDVYKLELPRSAEDQLKKAKRVKERRLKEGQLVFFKIEKGKTTSHVGVYLGNHKFIHASTSKGVRIDDLTDEYYSKHFLCGGKLN